LTKEAYVRDDYKDPSERTAISINSVEPTSTPRIMTVEAYDLIERKRVFGILGKDRLFICVYPDRQSFPSRLLQIKNTDQIKIC